MGRFFPGAAGLADAGHEVELSGWIRTEEVTEGFADLALFPSGEADHTRLTLDTLGRGVRGTTDWHRITLRRQIPDSASGSASAAC